VGAGSAPVQAAKTGIKQSKARAGSNTNRRGIIFSILWTLSGIWTRIFTCFFKLDRFDPLDPRPIF
jgi:hypothetical protein